MTTISLSCGSFRMSHDEGNNIPEFIFHQASGKLLILDQLLQKFHDLGHRVLLFAQMTHTLDILQVTFCVFTVRVCTIRLTLYPLIFNLPS